MTPTPGQRRTMIYRATRVLEDACDQWTCGYCGAEYVVPVLARDCEGKHEAET